MREEHAPIKRLVRNFLSLGMLRGFDLVVPLIVTPYLVAKLGMDIFGQINYSLSIAMYFGVLIQYGYSITAVREIARVRDDHEALRDLFNQVLWSMVVMAISVSLVFFLGVWVFGAQGESRLLLYMAYALVVAQSLMPTWFFQGVERMGYIAMFGFVAKAIYLIFVFVFVVAPSDSVLVLTGNFLSVLFVLVIAYALIFLKMGMSLRFCGWRKLVIQYKTGYDAFVTQLAPSLYNNSSVFILGTVAGGAAVGPYSAASTVVDAVVALGRLMSSVALPYLSKNILHHGYFKKIMLVGSVGAMIFVVAFSGSISELFFQGDELVMRYLLVMSLGIPAAYAFLVFNTNFLMLTGAERVARKIVSRVSVVFFVFGVLIIPFLGGVGACVLVVAARICMSLLSYYCYRVRMLEAGRNEKA